MKAPISLILGISLLVPGLASADKDYRAEAIAMLKRDFQTKGIATVDRLNEDELQNICNTTANNPSPRGAATHGKGAVGGGQVAGGR